MRKKILNSRKIGFTLLEILIVLGVISILASITVLVLKPAELLKESRDSTRIQDIRNIAGVITLGRTQSSSLLSNVLPTIVYLSLPDKNGTLNDNCRNGTDYPDLPALTGSWEYRCMANSTNLRKIDGTGWIPIDFTSLPGGGGFSALPIDPSNTTTDNLYYTFSLGTSGTSYSLSAKLQSQKYLAQIAANDGGADANSFETAPIAWTTTTSPMPDWNYRKLITIDETKVDADLTDFPVLVKLTSSNFDFSKARSDGYDIRFTSSDGSTLLKYERERHDNFNNLAEYWVKIPSVSGSVNTEFYIYYDNSSAANGEDPTNVWDSGHKGVWHKKDLTTSSIKDSTNTNNGNKTAANEPIEIDGQIGKAQSYDGSNDYVNLGNDSSLNFTTENFTIAFWIKPTVLANAKIIFSRGVLNTDGYEVMAMDNGQVHLHTSQSSGNQMTVAPNGTLANNVWSHITVVRNGSTGYIYKNGVDVTSSQPSIINPVTNTRDAHIGSRSNNVNYINATIDEVRVSNIVRSSAWIKADYNSGYNSLMSFGGEESI